MTRVLAFALTCLMLSLFPSISAAQNGVPLNEKYTGKIGGTMFNFTIGGAGGTAAYVDKVPVKLKAGRGVTVTVTVVGDNRKAAIHLLDPDGKRIGDTPWGMQSASLPLNAVNDDGLFTILVLSDLKGPFELLVSDDRVRALENEIKALEKTLEEKKKALAEARKEK
jgi:hypothetical protein